MSEIQPELLDLSKTPKVLLGYLHLIHFMGADRIEFPSLFLLLLKSILVLLAAILSCCSLWPANTIHFCGDILELQNWASSIQEDNSKWR